MRLLQNAIASEVTSRVHSKEDLEMAIKASKILFGKSTSEDLKSLDEETFISIFEGVPQFKLEIRDIELGILDILSEKTKIFTSKGETRRMIKSSAVSINKEKITPEEIEILEGDVSGNKLFLHCCEVFPGRFFDILYKKEEIFQNEEINTKFLPNIDFKYFFEQNITEKTKDTLWKYLQLILFSISGTLTASDSFGETAKLFEAINEDEFKSKLEETINDMSGLFDMSGNDLSGNDISMNMPNPEDINDHINGLLKGKLGSLAAEIAEETAKELDIDIEDQENANVNKVFEKLFKNPGRLLTMVKKVGSKLDEKIRFLSSNFGEETCMKSRILVFSINDLSDRF